MADFKGTKDVYLYDEQKKTMNLKEILYGVKLFLVFLVTLYLAICFTVLIDPIIEPYRARFEDYIENKTGIKSYREETRRPMMNLMKKLTGKQNEL